MKIKAISLVLFISCAQAFTAQTIKHSYVSSSVLAKGKIVKIGITESGIYKLTYEKLVSLGIDPQNVHVFGFGGGVLEQSFSLPKIDDLPEIPIYLEKGDDGIFGPGDCTLFYGQGVVRWSYDSSTSTFTHINNPYSQYGYYFVSSNAVSTAGIRIATKNAITIPTGAVVKPITEFIDYKVSEKDIRTLSKSGKEFYGDDFNSTLLYNYTLNFPNIICSSPNTVKARLDVAANSVSTFTLNLNDTQSQNLAISNGPTEQFELAVAASNTFNFTPASDDLSFGISYSKPTANSIGYMNFLEVTARRLLKMNGSMMQFQNADWLGNDFYNKYVLTETNANVQVWDITNPQDVYIITTTFENGNLSFTDSSKTLKRYIAIDTKASALINSPANETVIPNQDLHGTMQQADLVIITHPDFVSQAQALAKAHYEKDKLIGEVVTTDQVYNEFSSGTPDATAYRWVMKMLYDRATTPTDLPKYLLLFGRGTFDNKKILNKEAESGDNRILTYQDGNSLSVTKSFVTDDYFGYLSNSEGTDIATSTNSMDIGVGRFPVTTTQQATDVVNKTIAYMNNKDKGSWKNQICFLADDGDGTIHMDDANKSATGVEKSFRSYQVNKIYLDAYQQEVSASGQTYPLAKTRFQNLLRTGLFMLNYSGHASAAGWTNEQILTTADVKLLSNKHLPFWWAATCEFMQFDVKTVSGGESVLLNPSGGGIGVVSATRPVYQTQNYTLNKYFSDNIYKKVNGKQQRVGDVIAAAKNSIYPEVNKLCYVYMGDPALMLNFPTNYNILTTKVNESTTFGNDTLRALSVATISGIIADDNGEVQDFNGKLHAIVYDKSQQFTTLNNDGEKNTTVLQFSDRPNAIFSGDAIVKKGYFNFSFMLPKDIKYNYGTGRINYYAQDDSANVEAQGYFENFLVGGSNLNYVEDTAGPTINIYLNDSLSTSRKVNETPLLLATISDNNGINTVGGGIGHDILLTIDKDPYKSFTLNEYFQAETGSYSKGIVKFKLPELSDGEHSLTLRAWDLLNNSTTKSMTFEVIKGLAPVIFSVYNWPDQVSTETHFVIKNDRPETMLSATVEVIDLAGRVLWNSGPRANVDNIFWDLTSNNGQKVKAGVYLYRVNLKTTNSGISSKTNKMLIVGK